MTASSSEKTAEEMEPSIKSGTISFKHSSIFQFYQHKYLVLDVFPMLTILQKLFNDSKNERLNQALNKCSRVVTWPCSSQRCDCSSSLCVVMVQKCVFPQLRKHAAAW